MPTLDDVMARRITDLETFDAHFDDEGRAYGIMLTVFPDGTWAYVTGTREDGDTDLMHMTETPDFLPILLRAVGLVGDEG
jgi:hypothetical protein